jgi:hypothetical protein
MKKLYELCWDCGRMGMLEGLFVAEESDMDALMGKEIYFGEVLGKHSEIFGPLEERDITIKNDDEDFINKLVDVIGGESISGYNPFDYYEDEE